MIGNNEKEVAVRKPRAGELTVEVSGEISADNTTDIEDENSAHDVMVGAVLERLHGDISDMTWADVIRHLRSDGVEFQIFDE